MMLPVSSVKHTQKQLLRQLFRAAAQRPWATAVCTGIASTLGKPKRALMCERWREMNKARVGPSLAEPVGRYSTTEVQKHSLTFQEV